MFGFGTENLIELIRAVGYLGVFAIVFAESGLFFGFFLPGDSLLFTVGFLASQGYLDIALSMFLIFAAAVAGDSVGYFFGKKVGSSIFSREDSFLFHKNNLAKAKKFYEKHGSKTIVIARFVPIVRTFAPIVAGVGQMDYRKFISYNIFGGLAWSLIITGGGYFLGKSLPQADKYLTAVIFGIICVSLLPVFYSAVKNKLGKPKFLKNELPDKK
jgi:membrane-associated protein